MRTFQVICYRFVVDCLPSNTFVTTEFEIYGPMTRTACGFVLGILFILLTKKLLESYEHLQVGDIAGANAQKIVLIIFVMTLHSLTEGIGIGVSFGESNSKFSIASIITSTILIYIRVASSIP